MDYEPDFMTEDNGPGYDPSSLIENEPEFDLGEAARKIGISVPTIKRWIYRGIIKSEKNQYNHHRIKQSEVIRVRKKSKKPIGKRIIKILETQKVAYTRQIKIALETAFSHQETSYKLKQLVKDGKVMELTVKNTNGFPFSWYYLPRIDKSEAKSLVKDKMKILKTYYDYIQDNKFRDPADNSERYDDYSEFLVEKCLNEAGFIVLKRNTYRFRGKIVRSNNGQGDSKDLDFIVLKPAGQVFIGVQVKNQLDSPTEKDVKQLLDLCDGLDLKPMLISRVCEPRFFLKIKAKGGRIIVFKRQFLRPEVPRDFFDRMNEMGIPIGVYRRPPVYLTNILKRNKHWFK